MQAETLGSIGNQDFGSLLPIEPIEGLGTATLADVLIPGENEENDESLRKRFLQKVREQERAEMQPTINNGQPRSQA
ncbi:Baseplate J-like protein [Anoxybacillus sp. BCO1]|nr:Baseplate J-like protein [Anoxybacillus sp. BCO1]